MDVVIEKLVFGGFGLARTADGIILVEDVLPNERVIVSINRKTGGTPFATPKKIVTPSPFRVVPNCSYYSQCGGCDWQHIAENQQLKYKEEILRETMFRIARVSLLPAIECFASQPWHYRHRAQIQIDHETGRAGFFRRKSNEIVAIESCPILISSIEKLLLYLNSGKYSLSGHQTETKNSTIRCIAGSDDTIASDPQIRGVSQKTTGICIDRYRVFVTGSSFFQSNRYIFEKMGKWARSFVNGDFFIDMYGGHGLFSLCLADRFKKGLLVEEDKIMANAASLTFKENSIRHIEALAIRAEDFFEKTIESFPFIDCLVVDPPRLGLSERVRLGIEKVHPATIVYVSCNVSTMARDIGHFMRKSNYIIDHIGLFDCTPQSSHLETIVILRNTKK